jgi:hypothetical protein
MAEASTHLTQNVLPLMPYQQFVVSFPIPMRYWLQTNKRFAAEAFGLSVERFIVTTSPKPLPPASPTQRQEVSRSLRDGDQH